MSPRMKLLGLAQFCLSLYDFMVDLLFSSQLCISSSFSKLLDVYVRSGK